MAGDTVGVPFISPASFPLPALLFQEITASINVELQRSRVCGQSETIHARIKCIRGRVTSSVVTELKSLEKTVFEE